MNSRLRISRRSGTALAMMAALSSMAWGCGSSDNSAGNEGTVRASLHRAKSCGDLLGDLKADANFKLNKGIDQQIQQIQQCITHYGDANCAYYGGIGYDNAGGGAPPPMAVGEPTAGGADSGESAGSGNGNKATDFSQTNTQVAGVDEADIVKTDGSNLYVLHGRAFKVLKAWPANELAELSSIDLEGQPTEMFVDGGQVVVYSNVNGAAVYTAAGVTPKSQYRDYGMAYASDAAYPGDASGVYAPLTKVTVLSLQSGTPTVTREIYFEGNFTDARRVGPHVRTVLSGYAHGPQLKYSIYDLYPGMTTGGPNGPDVATPPSTGTAEPAPAPAPAPPPAADGGIGTKDAKTAPQYPQTGTAMISMLEQLRTANLDIIAKSQLTDWLPYTFVKQGAQVTAQNVACEDFYVPNAGSTESGITEIAAIDLSNPAAPPKQTAILGHAETVYGTADTLYLASNAWVQPPVAWASSGIGSSGGGVSGSGGTAVASPPATDPGQPEPAQDAGSATPQSIKPLTTQAATTVTGYATSKTHLHKFEFTTDATFPNYVASGTVPGYVKDQFALDDKDGVLRVATSEQRIYIDSDGNYASSTPTAADGTSAFPSTVNHVYTLGVAGGWLEQLGTVGDLAPNETIYSVRFIDHRGYVVTYRQVDPLFVVELSDPAHPSVLAALKIPGFSEYMHPLDATHILTIGRDGDSGRPQNIALQIFDVANGSNPVLAQKFVYSGDEYGSSMAEYDHKAFTYFADRQLLAFPYYAYNANTATGMRSSLELFKVDVAGGFTKLGSIDHTALIEQNPSGYCGGYYGPEVRRGVFLENFVFSVSYGGVVAKDTNDLAGAGSQLALPAPQVDSVSTYGAPICAY